MAEVYEGKDTEVSGAGVGRQRAVSFSDFMIFKASDL